MRLYSRRAQEPCESISEAALCARACLTFPNNHDAPTVAAQCALYAPVPGCVPLQLLYPVTAARRRNAAPPASVHVPEAAAHEDYLAQSSENQIGIARQ